MRAFDATGALALSTSMIEQTDPFDGFLILRNWILSEPSAKGILDHLGEVYSRRNPQLAPYVQPTIDSVARGLAIHQRRIRLTEPRHRLLLAILLNVPDWRSCTELIRAAFPEAEPAAVLATLFGELASPEWRNIADVSAGPAEIAALQTALRSAGPRTDLHALVEPLVQREPSP
jgi:hypothetical protein